MTGLLSKILAGADSRKTRLHDEKGNIVPFGRLLRNAPSAIVSGVLRLAIGYRPVRPWISYDAQKILNAHLNARAGRVLEFGSGMSTAWYAARAASVVSVEDNKAWLDIVCATLRAAKNIDYRYAASEAEYTIFPDGHYDLVMVDGSFRPQCVQAAAPHLSPSGIIYLDNSDKAVGGLPGDVPLAEQLLKKFAEREGRPITDFTDFAPTQLFVQQGMLVGPRP